MPLIPLMIAAVVALNPISIDAPHAVTAGTTLCFQVSSVDGFASVLVEVNRVAVPTERSPGVEPGTIIVCCRVPAGSAGSSVTVTAVSASGAVATATVSVT